MAVFSPTVLSYPDGYTLAASQNLILQDNILSSTANNPLNSSAPADLSGWYDNLPSIVVANATTTRVASPIPCSGFEEAYIYPVNALAGASVQFAVYLIWGDKMASGTSNRYFAQLTYDLSTAMGATNASYLTMRSPGGINYKTYGAIGTGRTNFSAILDSTAGCQTAQSPGGTASPYTPYTLGLAHLGGADYMAIVGNTYASGAHQPNFFVRFG